MGETDTAKKKTHKAIIIRVAALAVVAIAVTAVFFITAAAKQYPAAEESKDTKAITLAEMKQALDVDTFYPGITINGVDVSGKTKEEAASLLADSAKPDAPKISITLSVNGREYPLDPSIFTITSNLPTVIDNAYNYNRADIETEDSDAIADKYQAVIVNPGAPSNFEIEYTTSCTQVDAAVHNILDPLETQAVDAVVTSFDKDALAFVIEDSSAGVAIDIDGAISDVKSAVAAKEFTKTIPVKSTVTEPKVSKENLEATLGLVSSFTTKTTDKPNRNSNINLVCETIDGLVLQPGEYFNFNEYIGQRTAAKGYKEAIGIYGGTTRMELGGGICQTTGTLFHSVMMADLQVDERNPHTWPSDYVDIGTDATVTWGGKNFQFTNNTEYPIAIHAYYNDRHVTMEIYGRPVEDGMTIEIEGNVTGRSGPGAPSYIANPSAAVGSNSTVRGGHDYISAECYKVYYKDGTEVKRVLACRSVYPAITPQISVGVLASDGSVCAMNPSTGAVSVPAAPTAAPQVTDTQPAATETVPAAADTSPVETVPAETTATVP